MLKPCPFCGGKAKVCVCKPNTKTFFVVKCTECLTASYIYEGEATAAEHWNRRITDESTEH